MKHVTDLDAVHAPIEQARGLPNEHYVDPAVFAEERKSVLFDNWAGVGFGKDVPEAGDARPIDFLGMPLLLVRDRNGGVNVFQNTCRHRGMILVDQPTRIRGAIRCPYHSWCYGLDGGLRTTPHIGGPGQNTHEDVDPTALGLVRVRSHVWLDVVYVNVNGNAEPFEEVHADLLARWADFDQPMHFGGEAAGFQLEVNTNWKLAVENYCESYHLPWVHPGLNSYSRLEDHYNIEGRSEYSGQGTLVYQQLKDAQGNVLPDFSGLPSKWHQGGEYVSLYPNVLLGVQRDHAFALILQPIGLEKTIEHVALYFAQAPGGSEEQDGLRAESAQRWREVFKEDIFVVEGMQRGRHGLLFDGGHFSPAMDGPTHNFHKWVATQVEAGRAAA
ncbi:aromatic ring-hydroxylating oxygenase subunit alpha [Sphingomonas sp. CLY1604]|uniref:aromatic ring-hydroxylating oxygenase subunit alpha n=1 Tax=Sphingomonas sp. CLY1604 TaxID=3457786 RepID=UPI003FD87E37